MMVTLGAAVRTELINDLWRGELKEMGKRKQLKRVFLLGRQTKMHHVVLLQVTRVSSAHSTDAISPFTGQGQDDDYIKAIIRSKLRARVTTCTVLQLLL